MGDELTFAKKNGSQNFRIRTASTKVTQSEFAELDARRQSVASGLANGFAKCSFESFVIVTI